MHPQLAALPAVEAVDVALPPRANVAYVPGVSDNVAPALADLGLPVTVVDSTALGTGDLSRYTHVVVGPRAYESNAALAANNARLLDWARRGGTMVLTGAAPVLQRDVPFDLFTFAMSGKRLQGSLYGTTTSRTDVPLLADFFAAQRDD